MVMTLSLLVYTTAQRRLRQALAQVDETIPNQIKQPSKRPTMRWVFQILEGINYVVLLWVGIYSGFVDGLSWVLIYQDSPYTI